MNILLLGSGGREHAIAWKLTQSDSLTKLFIAPGNGGTIECGINVSLNTTDFNAIGEFCLENSIDLIISGSEQPAVEGIWDFFQEEPYKSIQVIAPSKEGARLEGEKSYAKDFMKIHKIPTADSIEVTAENIQDAFDWFEKKTPPFVIKADGLAAGKGVVLPNTQEEAKNVIKDFILNKKFGVSSQKVILEDFIDGKEFSVFIYTNGTQYVLLPNARDYKRRFDNNQGPNTGGMGCISPVPYIDNEILQNVEKTIIKPTIQGLSQEKIPYQGFIYFGLILDTKGDVHVIEYNCRLGDPEAEVILPRLENDLIELFQAGLNYKLEEFPIKINSQSTATVILVSDGYPEHFEKGFKIIGIENVTKSIVFHAGTKLENHEIVTNGGRVLAITSMGDTITDAVNQSYDSIQRIHFKNMSYRKDIGL